MQRVKKNTYNLNSSGSVSFQIKNRSLSINYQQVQLNCINVYSLIDIHWKCQALYNILYNIILTKSFNPSTPTVIKISRTYKFWANAVFPINCVTGWEAVLMNTYFQILAYLIHSWVTEMIHGWIWKVPENKNGCYRVKHNHLNVDIKQLQFTPKLNFAQ